jgi:hypothetical protein
VCDQEVPHGKDVERIALANASRIEGHIETGNRLELVADFWLRRRKEPDPISCARDCYHLWQAVKLSTSHIFFFEALLIRPNPAASIVNFLTHFDNLTHQGSYSAVCQKANHI